MGISRYIFDFLSIEQDLRQSIFILLTYFSYLYLYLTNTLDITAQETTSFL
jgi:hypothetical protein